jgi:hypothetical protein
VKQQARSGKRSDVLIKFLATYPNGQAYTQENLAAAFRKLNESFGKENEAIEIDGEKGDFSFLLARDLENKKIKIETLPEGAYQRRITRLTGHGEERRHPLSGRARVPYRLLF